MRAWDYTDTYVAACLRPFNTHREGREHERDCPECQGIIRGDADENVIEEAEDETMDKLPKVGGFSLLPCKPDVCQECAVDHEPEAPHNQQSLYYQYKFYAANGRWPTWKDALAHCSEELRTLWIKALKEKGVEVEP